ncbi:hypothetical protein [Thermococcus sp.]|uniref:hypothetical protein n=1 Tax=Thermococcus sp. TaxID=35749 RepID=UPI002639FAA3|nr:hypothetical protein [Thermococcus sp.]
MKVRLGYPDRIVEVDEHRVYVFKGKRLFSAPLDEVLGYILKGDGLLPPAVKEVSRAVFDAALNGGYIHGKFGGGMESIRRVSV